MVSAVLFSELAPQRTVIYTDGACQGNPGPGGWAWAESSQRYESGFETRTTNQRMELLAVLRGLDANPGPVVVMSDSTYVVNCFRQKWWRGWQARAWRNSKGEPVANQDLWRPLIELVVEVRAGEVALEWVKGHSGDEMNDLVDRLAVEASRLQVATSSLR